jgi:hypothetical protein
MNKHRSGREGGLAVPEGWVSLARIAGMYGLKTREAQEIAKKLGIPAQRGGALLSPSQQEKMHAELKNRQRLKELRESNAKKGRRLVYESSDTGPGFLEETDRMRISGEELFRHLNPELPAIADDDESEIA